MGVCCDGRPEPVAGSISGRAVHLCVKLRLRYGLGFWPQGASQQRELPRGTPLRLAAYQRPSGSLKPCLFRRELIV